MAAEEFRRPDREVIEHYQIPATRSGFISRHFADQSHLCDICKGDDHSTTVGNDGRPLPEGPQDYLKMAAEGYEPPVIVGSQPLQAPQGATGYQSSDSMSAVAASGDGSGAAGEHGSEAEPGTGN
jgi:hypothetical protein